MEKILLLPAKEEERVAFFPDALSLAVIGEGGLYP
jgi:hypothetical protein